MVDVQVADVVTVPNGNQGVVVSVHFWGDYDFVTVMFGHWGVDTYRMTYHPRDLTLVFRPPDDDPL